MFKVKIMLFFRLLFVKLHFVWLLSVYIVKCADQFKLIQIFKSEIFVIECRVYHFFHIKHLCY